MFWRRRKHYRDEDTSPAALVARAESALADDPVAALRLAQRARDRNDDFVNALPGMWSKVPLREVVYHPKLYDVLVSALDRCATGCHLSLPQVVNAALREWRCMDDDWPKAFACGDPRFWGLFLSDCMHLYATAFASGVRPSQAGEHDGDRGIVMHILEHARLLPSGHLTRRGVQARAQLCALIGASAPATDRFLIPPETFTHLPCGNLITQEDIRRWMSRDREPTGEPEVAVADLPTYVTERPRYPRPATTDLTQLRRMAMFEGVGKAVSNVDAWWTAVDLAVYRWEVLHRFDVDTCNLVRQLSYDTYAAKIHGEAPDSALWAWQHFIDLFHYCYERTTALMPTVSRDRPNDRREAQGARNWFASTLLQVLCAAGDTTGANAFAPEVHAILSASHPQNLTAFQAGLLRALESGSDPCN